MFCRLSRNTPFSSALLETGQSRSTSRSTLPTSGTTSAARQPRVRVKVRLQMRIWMTGVVRKAQARGVMGTMRRMVRAALVLRSARDFECLA